MPELPEVETIAQAIHQTMTGQTITSIRFYRSDLRDPIPTKALQSGLCHSKILKVFRRAKYMLIHTEFGFGVFHLGMTGNFLWSKSPRRRVPHTHVVFTLSDGSGSRQYLHYVDPRRFGRMGFCSAEEIKSSPWFKDLGPEPLDRSFDLGLHLWEKSRNSRAPIKTFLMDNKNLVGVGNIYACEALFRVGLAPDIPSMKLSRAKWGQLACEVQKVLQAAIAAGGTSFRDFKKMDGKPGYFKVSLSVYNRCGQACNVCSTPIARSKHAGRSTFYCPLCQK